MKAATKQSTSRPAGTRRRAVATMAAECACCLATLETPDEQAGAVCGRCASRYRKPSLTAPRAPAVSWRCENPFDWWPGKKPRPPSATGADTPGADTPGADTPDADADADAQAHARDWSEAAQ